MKIIVLHGEDTEKSYARLKKFIDTAKERSWEVAFLDEIDIAFRENLNSSSLFGNERFFILSNLQKIGKKDFEWLNEKYPELRGNLIIYHEGILGTTVLKSFPKDTKIEEFKLPKLIWSFLEEIYPGNSKKIITDFHKIIEKDAPEFVFTLIARQFKLLYTVTLPEKSSLQEWQVVRLKRQSGKFTQELLRKIIESLSQIDIDVKTGKADLVSSLDLLMLTLLK